MSDPPRSIGSSVRAAPRQFLRRGLYEPWLISNELRRLLALPYVRLAFLIHGVRWGRNWRIFGTPMIQRHIGSSIRIGAGMSLRSWQSSNPLSPYHRVVLATRTSAAVIDIGDDCGFTGATLVAAERIHIGNRVLLGSNVIISDTDFHPIDPLKRLKHVNDGRHAPVTIEDDVFVGANAIILKGVTLGASSVIGAGSVVTSSVPPRTIAAGNPARVINRIDPVNL